MIDIFKVPVKEKVNRSMSGKSVIVCGKSKAGKSTLCSQAPRPIFLCTENGTEAITGITPIPIASWSDFKAAVNQLCTPQGRENFDTVVIDTATNLILLLDKYIGNKLSTEKTSFDFGSDADYGKGTKAMRNELGIQLQKLANQGYLIMNIIHAEDKTNFDTGKEYVGTSLSNSLYGVMEKFVDQIIYLRRDEDKRGNITHTIWFNPKGGFAGAGGRFTPSVDSTDCTYKALESAMMEAIDKSGVATVVSDKPAFTISNTEDEYDFEALMKEFNELTNKLVDESAENITRISNCVTSVLGPNRKASSLTKAQAELLHETIEAIKKEFGI